MCGKIVSFFVISIILTKTYALFASLLVQLAVTSMQQICGGPGRVVFIAAQVDYKIDAFYAEMFSCFIWPPGACVAGYRVAMCFASVSYYYYYYFLIPHVV